jgi:hypothetical protein
MNHMQTNSKSNITANVPRISQAAATAVAMVSLLFLPSLIGSVTASTPSATPPVPLIQKGSVKLNFSTVASGLTAPPPGVSDAD